MNTYSFCLFVGCSQLLPFIFNAFVVKFQFMVAAINFSKAVPCVMQIVYGQNKLFL